MSEATAENRSPTNAVPPYRTSWEHLSDEFRRLDLLINLRVLRQAAQQPDDPLEPFRGLVLSREQISALLVPEGGRSPSESQTEEESSECQRLADALRALSVSIQERVAASRNQGIVLTLPYAAEVFALTPFECQCLVICLAPEVRSKYELLYAYLQNDVTRKKPSVDLVLSLLCGTDAQRLQARWAFEVRAPLLRYRLVELSSGGEERTTLLSRQLALDDRIVNLLLGFDCLDVRLQPAAQTVPANRATSAPGSSEELVERVCAFVRSHAQAGEAGGRSLLFYVHGLEGSGKRTLVESVCRQLGRPLLVVDVARMLGSSVPFEELVCLLGREVVLRSSVLCVKNLDCLVMDREKHQSKLAALLDVVRQFSSLTFMLGSAAWRPPAKADELVFVDVEFRLPREAARKSLWEDLLRQHPELASQLDAGALASRFRFTRGQIREALRTALHHARWTGGAERRGVTQQDLYSACRAQCHAALGGLARKIQPKHAWDDIVLPADQLAQLNEICQQVKYRHIVYGEWGFDRKLSLGKGLNVLFSGPPGTGKTMAAEVMANELQLDLYKIDLSQVVSKYIGETEKNLDCIFAAAENANAILFFDEADALFGKRSEVRDAHDRYANIEVGYLLQKMEEYEGAAILATNLRQHMDEAFVRRMHAIVEFPFPDEESRRLIWQVTFPREAPVADQVDFDLLARRVRLAGGNIKNIALAAAFYAAADGGVIRMDRLWQAARREYQKVGRTWDNPKEGSPEAPIAQEQVCG